MRRNVGEVAFSRPDRANKVLFDELQFLGDTTERIVGSLEQGNSPFDIGCNVGICLGRINFVFVDQRYSEER
jgi:hypothetical protein